MRKSTSINSITRTIDIFSKRAVQASCFYRRMMELNCGIAGIEFATQKAVYQRTAAELAIAFGLASEVTISKTIGSREKAQESQIE